MRSRRRREELAWAAGFVDGEGHFGCPKNRDWRQITLTISQADVRPLERMQKALGMGRVYGPYFRARSNTKPEWHFYLSNHERVQAAICLLWAWLSGPKQEQASRALGQFREYRRTCTRHKRPRQEPG